MRIIEVVHAFPPLAEGGSEVYAEAHARALMRGGDEVLVLTREQDPKQAEYHVRSETRDGLRIIRINNTFRHTRSFEDSYRNDAIGSLARRIIDDFKPDVAHIHHLTCLSTTIVPTLADRGIPCFMTLHDYWLICHRGQLFDLDHRICDGPDAEGACRRCIGFQATAPPSAFRAARAWRTVEQILPTGIAHGLETGFTKAAQALSPPFAADENAACRKRTQHMRGVMARVTTFLAPSQAIRERFIRFGIPSDRIVYCPYGFDRRPFNACANAKQNGRRDGGSPCRLGFIGSLMVTKAPHVLIEASRGIDGIGSVELFGIPTPYHGDSSYLRSLAPLLAADGVRYRGPVAHQRIPDALASLDVLVVPSVWPENSPLVIHEAFLAGVPVIASRIGGIPEIVDHERNGLLFEPGNVDDLRRTLARVVQEPGLLDRLRAGIGPVRAIEDDVAAARELYVDRLREKTDRGSTHPGPARGNGRTAPRIAAVVLNYRTPDETLLAVRSLVASRRPLDDIIVVDNADRDADADLTSPRGLPPERVPNLLHIKNGRNLGFSGGVNVGIRAALERGAHAVLLVNSDVILPPDCVDRLERGLTDASASCGIVGPAIASRSAPAVTASLGMFYDAATGRMRHYGFGDPMRRHGRGDFGTLNATSCVDGVSACAMLIARKVFDAIGLFDEDYFFSFEDLDFCLRARRAGFETRLVENATAYHEGGQSIGASSPQRLYFAARNHMLLASRITSGASRLPRVFRLSIIFALNMAHALIADGGTLPRRIAAVVRGTRDYVAGRFGPA